MVYEDSTGIMVMDMRCFLLGPECCSCPDVRINDTLQWDKECTSFVMDMQLASGPHELQHDHVYVTRATSCPICNECDSSDDDCNTTEIVVVTIVVVLLVVGIVMWIAWCCRKSGGAQSSAAAAERRPIIQSPY